MTSIVVWSGFDTFIHTLIRVCIAPFWVSDTQNHSDVKHPKESNTPKGVKNIPKKGYNTLTSPFKQGRIQGHLKGGAKCP